MGPTLDVAIGLVFTFLLFALLLTAVMEMIAAGMKLRARALEDAIIRMLDEPAGAQTMLGKSSAWLGAMFGKQKARRKDQAAVDRAAPENAELHEGPVDFASGSDAPSFVPMNYHLVYCHPLVGGSQAKDRPSYVPPQNFSVALLSSLRAGASGAMFSDIERSVATLPPGLLREAMTTALDEAAGDYAKLKSGIETWYDTAMARLSGEYKRFTQAFTFVLGFAVAALCNVDAVNVTHRLFTEPALRESLASQAQGYVTKTNAEAAAEQAKKDKQAAEATAKAGEDETSVSEETPAAPAGQEQAVTPEEPADDGSDSAKGKDTEVTVADIRAKQKAVEEAQLLLMTTAPVGWPEAEQEKLKKLLPKRDYQVELRIAIAEDKTAAAHVVIASRRAASAEKALTAAKASTEQDRAKQIEAATADLAAAKHDHEEAEAAKAETATARTEAEARYTKAKNATKPDTRPVLQIIVTHIPGWLIAALAGMLGAPFWFDLLQKLVSVRGTGPKPASTLETAKS